MAPRIFSRYTFSTARRDADGRLLLDEQKRFTYRDRDDNVEHVVVEGDSLHSLAGKYFQGMPRPSGLWWIIADFQPVLIHDPTIALVPGAVVVVPSLRTVQEEVFSEARRR